MTSRTSLAHAMPSAPSLLSYRLRTALDAFRYLYNLPKERVDAFLDAYDMYDYDWVDEPALINKLGHDYYGSIKKKLVNQYSVLNHLCALGEIEKMYLPPALDLSVSITANQMLFEERMARDLRLEAGDTALDLGCGRGRVACHIASLTGARVTGINIDPEQIANAIQFAERQGLAQKSRFLVADFNDLPLPFADQSFNAWYQIQALSLSKDLEALFRDTNRLLKPGGRVGWLDWARLDKYDPANPHHADLMKRIKPLVGAIGTPSPGELADLLHKTGFEVLESRELSVGGHQGPIIAKADRFYTRVARAITVLVRIKLLPPHIKTLLDRLTKNGKAFVEAAELGLVTASYYIVAQKTGDA